MFAEAWFLPTGAQQCCAPTLLLLTNFYGLAIAKISWALHDEGVSSGDARDYFGVRASLGAEGYRAPLGLVVFHKKDDIFSILVMNCALGNQDGGSFAAGLLFLFRAKKSH